MKNYDRRLIGKTVEYIFLSLLNQKDIFCQSFDTEGIDCIVFDVNKKVFSFGKSPFYVQVKSRSVKNTGNKNIVKNLKKLVKKLNLDINSIYLAIGFDFKNDIRQIKLFLIPFEELKKFKSKKTYRFSVKKCEKYSKEGVIISFQDN